MEIVRSSRSAVTFAISLLSALSTFINSSMENSCSMQEICCSLSVLRYKICTRKFPRRRIRSVSTSISSICTSPRLSIIFSTSGRVSGTFISSSSVICTFCSNFKIPERTAFFSTFINKPPPNKTCYILCGHTLPVFSASLSVYVASGWFMIFSGLNPAQKFCPPTTHN